MRCCFFFFLSTFAFSDLVCFLIVFSFTFEVFYAVLADFCGGLSFLLSLLLFLFRLCLCGDVSLFYLSTVLRGVLVLFFPSLFFNSLTTKQWAPTGALRSRCLRLKKKKVFTYLIDVVSVTSSLQSNNNNEESKCDYPVCVCVCLCRLFLFSMIIGCA